MRRLIPFSPGQGGLRRSANLRSIIRDAASWRELAYAGHTAWGDFESLSARPRRGHYFEGICQATPESSGPCRALMCRRIVGILREFVRAMRNEIALKDGRTFLQA